MGIGMFVPEINNEHKYAVGVMTSGDSVCIIKTYEDLDNLKTGYKEWRTFASQGKLSLPVPLELVNFRNGSGQCKILEDIMKEFPE